MLKRSEKIKLTEEIYSEVKKYPTIVIINLTKIPAQLQKNIRAKIKGYSKMLPKPVINNILKKLNIPYEVNYSALLIATELTPFKVDLALKESAIKVAAKPGEISNQDIIVEEMDTDLSPGPSLSLLKQAGLDARVDKGKIKIAKTSTLVKAGSKITPVQAQALQLLKIKPFSLRANIEFAYDGVVYKKDHFNIELEALKDNLAVNIRYGENLANNSNYPNSTSIHYIISKAYNQAKNLSINGNIYSKATITDLIAYNINIGNNIKKLLNI